MARTIIAAALAARLAGSAVAQTPPPAVTAQPPAPGQEHVQLTFILAAGSKCGWLTALEQRALEVSVRERLAALGALGDADEVVAAYLAARETEARGKALDCNGPQAETGKTQSKASADRLAAIWTARANAVATFAQPWAAGITTVDAQKTLLATEAAKAPNAAALKTRAEADAVQALEVICDERRTTRSATPRACPPQAPSERVFRAYARAWIEGVEAFTETLASPGAAQLAAVTPNPAPAALRPLNLNAPTGATRPEPAPVAPPPPPLPPSILAAGDLMTNYFKWTPGEAGGLSLDLPACAKGDLVIKPDRRTLGGATVSAPLMRLGDTAEVGKVSVRSGRTGVQYLSLTPDDAAKSAGIAAGGVFKQCPA